MRYHTFHLTVIITQHEDVFVVSFHEKALSGNLLNCLGVSIQFPNPSLVSPEDDIVPIRLLLQFNDALAILHMVPNTVFIEEPNDKDTQDTDNGILQKHRMPNAEKESLDATKYFHITLI